MARCRLRRWRRYASGRRSPAPSNPEVGGIPPRFCRAAGGIVLGFFVRPSTFPKPWRLPGRRLALVLWFLCALACFGVHSAARAQQSPFVPEDTFHKLVNEISGDIALDNLRWLAMCHATSGRADDFQLKARPVGRSAGEWYYGTVKLEDVEAFFSGAEREKALGIILRALQKLLLRQP